MKKFITLILIFLLNSTCINSQSLDKIADAIYYGGEIITIEDALPFAEAVAIKDGKILAVGKESEIMNYKGNTTEMINLKGKTLMPGFIDNHLHHSLGGMLLSFNWLMAEEWILPDRHIYPVIGKEEYLKELTKLERNLINPDEWLNVFGYASYFHGKITRTELDNISKTRPIALWQRSFHETILNSKALELLGFNKENTINPQINYEDGHFIENAQQTILLPKIAPYILPIEKFKDALILESNALHSAGITTCIDPLGILGFTPEQNNAAREVHDRDNIPYRTYICIDARMFVPVFDEYKWLYAVNNADKMSGRNIIYLNTDAKTFCDGGFFSQLMQVKDGYTDGHNGQWIYDPEILFKASKLYYENNISNHIHVNGDLGIDSLLSMYSRILGNGKVTGSRVVFDHVGICNIEQIEKMKDMGIMVSVNPYYLTALGDIYSKIGLDPQRAHYISRVGSFVKYGIITALHSDYAMAPSQPLFLAWCAVNRITFSGSVLGPEEKVSIQDVLRLITINAAKQYALENEIGSIKVGKKADFVILGSNPLKIEPIKLKDIKIFATVFEGKYFPVDKPIDNGLDLQLWKQNSDKRMLAIQKYTNDNYTTTKSYLDIIQGNCCMCSSLINIAHSLNR